MWCPTLRRIEIDEASTAAATVMGVGLHGIEIIRSGLLQIIFRKIVGLRTFIDVSFRRRQPCLQFRDLRFQSRDRGLLDGKNVGGWIRLNRCCRERASE